MWLARARHLGAFEAGARAHKVVDRRHHLAELPRLPPHRAVAAAEAGAGAAGGDDGGAGAAEKAVDLDFNLVKQLLDSYDSQKGLPGPASNLLGSMGLRLPDAADAKEPPPVPPPQRETNETVCRFR